MNPRIKPMVIWRLLLIQGFMLIGLVACNDQPLPDIGPVAETPQAPSPAPALPEANQPKQLDSNAGAEATGEQSDPIPTATFPPDDAESVPTAVPPQPTEPPPQQAEFMPSDRPLSATDPSTFSLASGRVQLVEFFAFW